MDQEKYLDRINFKGIICMDENCLRELHICHLMTIPFEALDLSVGRKIYLDLDQIYDKVVNKRRGGYCYELNYLYHTLLAALGFKCHLISASIYNEGTFGPEFDHMAIVVILEDIWLVDVGYGDLFLEPIKIDSDLIQKDKFKNYKVEQNSNEYILYESLKEKEELKIKYRFKNVARDVSEFSSQNIWKQSSIDSHFVKNRICTIPTQSGRKTIFNNLYKERKGDIISETNIEDEIIFSRILREEFGMELD
jgi:N-hydroxyarylamine O-acetyltransferase